VHATSPPTISVPYRVRSAPPAVPHAPTCAFLPRNTPRRRVRARLAMRLATVAVTARPLMTERARRRCTLHRRPAWLRWPTSAGRKKLILGLDNAVAHVVIQKRCCPDEVDVECCGEQGIHVRSHGRLRFLAAPAALRGLALSPMRRCVCAWSQMSAVMSAERSWKGNRMPKLPWSTDRWGGRCRTARRDVASVANHYRVTPGSSAGRSRSVGNCADARMRRTWGLDVRLLTKTLWTLSAWSDRDAAV
jgi:hypothetical protein